MYIYCIRVACDEGSTLNGNLKQHYVVSLPWNDTFKSHFYDSLACNREKDTPAMDTVRFASRVCGCTTLIACPASSRQFLLTCADNFCFGPCGCFCHYEHTEASELASNCRARCVDVGVWSVTLWGSAWKGAGGTQPKSHPPIAREPGAEGCYSPSYKSMNHKHVLETIILPEQKLIEITVFCLKG